MTILNSCRGRVPAAAFFVLASAIPLRLAAQTPDRPAPVDSGITNPATPAQPVPAPTQDNRIFGVLPNYRTADSTRTFIPLTSKQKFIIGLKDSFDWPGFIVAAGFAGVYQLDNQNPSFGQGIKGYVHRYATSYADQVIGNMMTESVMPSVLHEDPRYFRLIHGSVSHRTIYALSRVLICRTDTDRPTINASEILGNGVSASLGNAYYPDNRGFGDTMQRMGTSILTDAVSNVLKEFWPDIKKRYWKRHATADTM